MANYKDITTLVLDLDGTLTDGTYQLSSDGIVTKSFYTRDFHAMGEALRAGIDVLVLTQSSAGCMRKKKKSLKQNEHWKTWIEDGRFSLYEAISDKKKFIDASTIIWDNVFYIGDAENDIESMKKAALCGCPRDAIQEVLDIDAIRVGGTL